MDRRKFITSVAATSLSSWLSPALAKAASKNGLGKHWRIPGEFERNRAIWLGYDIDPEFSAVSVRMAAAILPYAELVVLAEDEEGLAHARSAMQAADLDERRITFIQNSSSRFFIRDYNVFCVGPTGLGVVDFQFNTYGLSGFCSKHLYPDNPNRAQRCASYGDTEAGSLDQWISKFRDAQLIGSPLFLEGGAVELNGRGTLIVSEPLALERNADLTKADIERKFLELPGVKKVVWLGAGVAEDPHMKSTITGDFVGFGAGFHTDEFVRFADARTILLAWPDAEDRALHPVEEITAQRMKANLQILKKATDQDGRPFKVIKIPTPSLVTRPVSLSPQQVSNDDQIWNASVFPDSEKRKVGDQLTQVAAASYLNYVVVNNLVLLPSYVEHGTPVAVQENVRRLFSAAFPGRDIKFIDAMRLNWAGGGIHCATCNEPAIV